MRKVFALAAAATAAISFSSPALADHHGGGHVANPAVDPALHVALADARRAEDAPRDAFRHPAEVLTFFGVKPGMTVVDYLPSGGWYTRILQPYLGENGTYVGMNPDVSAAPEFLAARMANLSQTLPDQVAEFSNGKGAKVVGFNADSLPEGMAGTVDRVLIFREIHNMFRFNWLHNDLVAMRSLLKDDGYLGVVQHRAKSNAPASYTDGNKGYLREKDVIALFEAHGFDLVATSEINANPKDPADHETGVWTLPPVYGGATDETRPALTAIGESDRMTLLFRKRP